MRFGASHSMHGVASKVQSLANSHVPWHSGNVTPWTFGLGSSWLKSAGQELTGERRGASNAVEGPMWTFWVGLRRDSF